MDNNIYQSLMRILDSFFVPYTETQIKKITPEEMQVLEENLDNLFIFAITWSMCCTTDYDGRLKLNAIVRELMKNNTKVQFPEAGLIYNYYFNQ